MVGEKIRNLRKSRNLTIVELSEQINVTSGYISQIERDLISPSLSVLKRLAEALKIPLSLLFEEENSKSIITIAGNERTKVKFGNINVELEFITPVMNKNDKDAGMEAFLFKLNPKSWISDNIVVNESQECIYVLSGEIQCHIEDKIFTLSKGDSIYVPGNNGHNIYNSYEDESEALCIVSHAGH